MENKSFTNQNRKNNFNRRKNFSNNKHKKDILNKKNKRNKKLFIKKDNKEETKEEEENKNEEIINIDEINNRSEENKEDNVENKDKFKDNEDIQEKNKENNKEETKKKINDENMKEIFIRNIGYSTSEEKLKELFTQIIPEKSIEFCLLCKDKETQNSKGSAFIKLTKESYNKVMSLYKEYSTNKRNFNEMNPFELEGRYLKLFDAMTREELKNLEKQKEQKNSKRNKTYLYYGLSKETISKFKEYENISEKDKEKRERLIQIKKENFYSNPNFHVSETRISFRNLDKNIDENILKEKINEILESDDNIQKEYKNTLNLIKKQDKSIMILEDNCKFIGENIFYHKNKMNNENDEDITDFEEIKKMAEDVQSLKENLENKYENKIKKQKEEINKLKEFNSTLNEIIEERIRKNNLDIINKGKEQFKYEN